MEDLLEYSHYKQLLCIYIDGDSSMHLTISSNRAIEAERSNEFNQDFYSTSDIVRFFNRAVSADSIKLINGYSIASESTNLFVKDLFPTYFDLQSKAQLSASEMSVHSAIVKYFQDMKQTVLTEPEDLLQTSQLVFILPIEWEGETQQSHVRNLLLDAGWITPEDGQNKLIFAPLIEVMIDHLQKSRKHRKQFIREGKYMFCYVRSGHNDKEILFNLICFQMQSAKEMSGISKTLASSNFMLVPSIKSSKTIRLSNTDRIARNVIEQLLDENNPQATQDVAQVRRSKLSFLKKPFKRHHHDQHCKSDVDTLKEITEATISELSNLYKIYNRYGSDEPWSQNTVHSKLKKTKFKKYILGLTCDRLITGIWDNANVKQFIQQVSDVIGITLKQYGTAEGSPDGIQDIILYMCNPRIKNASCTIIEDALSKRILTDVDILDRENAFIDTPRVADICTSAILKSVKMIQIANTVLPPIIVDQQDANGTLQCSAQTNNSSNHLIAPNTYYAQVLIGKQHVNFILNKVVKVPTLENAAIQKFTVLEKRIETPSIMETASENMWNHYQSLDPNVLQTGLLRRCLQKHSDLELSLRDYNAFKFSLMKMTKIWFSDTSPVAKKELASYQWVSIHEACDCALGISHHMLLEVGLRPAITKMATMIVGTLVSNDSFGLYYVPTIILTDSIMENPFFSYHSEQRLKESIQNCFYMHQRKPTLYFYNESKQANCQLTHYLGSGVFSQLSSTSYVIEFHSVDFSNESIVIGVQQADDTFSKKLNVESYKTELSHKRHTSQIVAKYLLLKRGDVLHPKGTSKRFMFRHCSDIRVDIVAVETSLNTKTIRRRIWSEVLSWGSAAKYPITVSISPVHHTSIVEISISCLIDVYQYIGEHFYQRLSESKRSLNIHERLHLRKASS